MCARSDIQLLTIQGQPTAQSYLWSETLLTVQDQTYNCWRCKIWHTVVDGARSDIHLLTVQGHTLLHFYDQKHCWRCKIRRTVTLMIRNGPVSDIVILMTVQGQPLNHTYDQERCWRCKVTRSFLLMIRNTVDGARSDTHSHLWSGTRSDLWPGTLLTAYGQTHGHSYDQKHWWQCKIRHTLIPTINNTVNGPRSDT